MRSVVTALLVCSCVPTMIAAPSSGPADVLARAQRAQRIVVATVTDVVPRFATNAAGDQLIVSRLWLNVEETWKGPASPIVVVDIEGGTIGDLTLRVSDLPTLRSGMRGLFFLNVDDNGVAQLSDRERGVLPLDSTNRFVGSAATLADVKTALAATAGHGR